MRWWPGHWQNRYGWRIPIEQGPDENQKLPAALLNAKMAIATKNSIHNMNPSEAVNTTIFS